MRSASSGAHAHRPWYDEPSTYSDGDSFDSGSRFLGRMSRDRETLSTWGPPSLVSAVLLIHAWALHHAALARTGGFAPFPLDDAFIHLALAKHLAFDGVYGISSHTFAAASSSVAWPYLLAGAMRLFGDRAVLPIIINAVFAVACVFAMDRGYRAMTRDDNVLARTALLAAASWMTPLPLLIVLGMEHTAHAFATLGLLLATARHLTHEPRSRDRVVVALWALSVTAFRYEGLFAIAFIAVLLLLCRRRFEALSVAAAGAVPIVGFGLYAMASGQRFLPLSVLLKRHELRFRDASDVTDWLGTDLMQRLGTEAYLSVLLVACVAATLWGLVRRERVDKAVVPALVALLIVAHVEFAALGWFYRYEAYLVLIGVFFGGARLLEIGRDAYATAATRPARIAFMALVGALVLACGAPLGKRALSAMRDAPAACQNIFQQQVQSGRFLATYFAKDRVAVNDIGAVAYLGHDRIVDLVGLASLDVATARRMNFQNPLSPGDIDRLTKDVEVAIVYDEWFATGLPRRWMKLGRWQIQDNKVCAFTGVSIYATRPESAPRVTEALADFAPKMPPEVFQTGPYLGRVPNEVDRIHPGDVIVVEASRPTDVGGRFTVWPNGSFDFPYCGATFVGRKTLVEAKKTLEECFARGVRKAETDVTLGAISRARAEPLEAAVGGIVPFGLIVPSGTSVNDAFETAGVDPKSVASAKVFRAGEAIETSDLRRRLEPGDLLLVAR